MLKSRQDQTENIGMNIRIATVLAISILMLLTVAGCCCPTPFWLGYPPPTDTPSSSSQSTPSSQPGTTTNATDFTWGADLNAGLQKAAAEGKPVLLDFWGGG